MSTRWEDRTRPAARAGQAQYAPVVPVTRSPDDVASAMATPDGHASATPKPLAVARPDMSDRLGLRHEGDQLVLDIEPLDMAIPVISRRTRFRTSEAAGWVNSFHRAFGLPRRAEPGLDVGTAALLALRTRLLDEETTEFADSAARRDLIGMADALADVVYVAYGTALTLGVDLDAEIRPALRKMAETETDPAVRSALAAVDALPRP